jgi:hypothetical protein
MMAFQASDQRHGLVGNDKPFKAGLEVITNQVPTGTEEIQKNSLTILSSLWDCDASEW